MGVSVSTPLTGRWRIYDHLEQVWECAGLSVLWAAGCVPVLTAGSSTVALLRVVAERREGSYRPILRAFWEEFVREPLVRAGVTIVSILAGLGVAAGLVTGLGATDDTTAIALQAAALLGGLLLLGLGATMMPLVAGGRRTSRRTLKLAAEIAARRPQTALAGAALTVATAVGIAWAPPLVLVLGWVWARLLVDLARSAARSLGLEAGDER